MPILEYVSGVHTAPKQFIEYIANTDKTDGAKYVSGINVPNEKEDAYNFMKRSFEHFSGLPFYIKPTFSLNETKKSKEKVRLHHYVQSFDPTEKLSVEEAHQIGIEWAKIVFGDKYQVLITTHIDKGHIHNHFAVSAYSLDGKQWHGNYSTLKKCRNISDQIAKEHGLKIVTPKHKNTMKYYEWLARGKGASLKQRLQLKMDELILDENVKSIDDLADKLRETGCEVRLGKFMTVKPPYSKRAYRTDNLDKTFGGYSIKELEYRILNKDKEFSDEAIKQFSGIQKTYAVYMRSIQITVYKKKSKKANYFDLVKNAELLKYLSENNITSVSELQDLVNHADEKYREQKIITDTLKKRYEYLSENVTDENKPFYEDVKFKLESENEKLKTLAEERKKAGDIYKTYISQTGDTGNTAGTESENKSLAEKDKNSKSDNGIGTPDSSGKNYTM